MLSQDFHCEKRLPLSALGFLFRDPRSQNVAGDFLFANGLPVASLVGADTDIHTQAYHQEFHSEKLSHSLQLDLEFQDSSFRQLGGGLSAVVASSLQVQGFHFERLLCFSQTGLESLGSDFHCFYDDPFLFVVVNCRWAIGYSFGKLLHSFDLDSNFPNLCFHRIGDDLFEEELHCVFELRL